MRIEIRGARLVDPAANTEANASLFIAEGKIAATGRAPDGFKPDEVIEAGGLVLCPGLVDL